MSWPGLIRATDCTPLSGARARRIITKVNYSAETQFKICATEPLRWRYWSGDYIVYNPFSGQTHFLDIVTGRVLTMLASGSSSVAKIRTEVARFLEVDDDEKIADATTELLDRLGNAGLIRPVC